MSATIIKAETRVPGQSTGRAMRRAGRVPGIYYTSAGDHEYLQIETLELARLLKQDLGLLELHLDGRKLPCVMREVQRHPVRGDIIHVDLYGVESHQKIRVHVPVHLVGTAKGTVEGGTVDVITHEIEVECLPGQLPNYIEVDISHLALNESIRLGDLRFEGIAVQGDPQTTVVHVLPPRKLEEEVPAAEAVPEEAGEPEVITERKEEAESEPEK